MTPWSRPPPVEPRGTAELANTTMGGVVSGLRARIIDQHASVRASRWRRGCTVALQERGVETGRSG